MSWDNEYVVFNDGSGFTHLLDLVAGEVLKVLEEAPADPSQVTNRVASKLDVTADPELDRRILETIRKFHEVGLVEPMLS
jgi:PqqD family protein of HPr-rel-A system